MNTEVKFSDFSLNPELLLSIAKLGYTNCSPIQSLTIAPILEGQDIFAQAETGSGKTAAFAIPILEQILRKRSDPTVPDQTNTSCIVLSPTRELAQQTHRVFNQLGESLGIIAECFIGGENIEKQRRSLEEKVAVVVATPGRLCDLSKQQIIDLSTCQIVVFDEADRLFDMGFKKEIEFILDRVDKKRQLIMVSATSNLDVLQTSYKYHSVPLEIKLNEDTLVVDKINHQMVMISVDEKMPFLVNMLRNQQDTYALVFCNTQIQTHVVAEWLKQMGMKSKAISGRLVQTKRTRLMEDFRAKKVTILVCTDVAARGLDIQDINLVVNYELPQDPTNYVHRIGRTGRAGKSGQAISFCAHEDCEALEAINKLIGTRIPQLEVHDDQFARDLCPRPRIDFKTLAVIEPRVKKFAEKPARPKTPIKTRSAKSEVIMKDIKPDNESTLLSKTQKNTITQKNEERGENIRTSNDQNYVQNINKDKRIFNIVSRDQSETEKAALDYFRINDKSLLEPKILKTGFRKYLFFGPRTITYQYQIRPIYKKILTPFLIKLLQLAKLKLYVKVFYDNHEVKIHFSGDDEMLLTKNNNDLLAAIEQVCRLYLGNKIFINEEMRLTAYCQNSQKQEKNLISLVDQLRKKVVDGQGPQLMRPLPAAERRIVHQYLGTDQLIKSTSIGDGRLKRIQLSLRTENVT